MSSLVICDRCKVPAAVFNIEPSVEAVYSFDLCLHCYKVWTILVEKFLKALDG